VTCSGSTIHALDDGGVNLDISGVVRGSAVERRRDA